MDDTDAIWKALSDPTRRGILDELKTGPRTVGQLAERFPRITRFAVMKHLNVLEEARLVATLKDGRERRCFLNAATFRSSYERWVDRFSDALAGSLTRLGRHAEAVEVETERAIRLRFRVAKPLGVVREMFSAEAMGEGLRRAGYGVSARCAQESARSLAFELDDLPAGWSDDRLVVSFTSEGSGATWVDVEQSGWSDDGRPYAEATHAVSVAVEAIRRSD